MPEVSTLYYAIIACYSYLLLEYSYRCTAADSDLEGPGASYRHREYSDALIDGYSIAQLWDEWGLVGDIIVRILLLLLCPPILPM